MKKWQWLLQAMSVGEHIYNLPSTNDRDSFKASVTRENRKNQEYKFIFRYSGLKALVIKNKRV